MGGNFKESQKHLPILNKGCQLWISRQEFLESRLGLLFFVGFNDDYIFFPGALRTEAC